MSKENVKAFYEALKADKALAEELAKKTAAEAVDVVIKFAAEKGYAFTAEELKAAETEEIDPSELDAVNAGAIVCLIIGFGKGEHKWGGCKIIGGGLPG